MHPGAQWFNVPDLLIGRFVFRILVDIFMCAGCL